MLPLLIVLGIGLGFFGGSLAELPGWWQAFPPSDSTHWLLWLWPLMLVLALSQTVFVLAPLPTAALRGLGGCAYAWLLQAPLRQQGAPLTISLLVTAGFGVGLALWCGLQERLARELAPVWFVAWQPVLLAGAGPMFLLGSSALLTQQALMLAGLGLLPLASPRRLLAGSLSLSAFGLTGLWLQAGLFSETRLWGLLSLLLPGLPVCLLLRRHPASKGLQGLLFGLSCLVLAGLLLALWLGRGQELYFG